MGGGVVPVERGVGARLVTPHVDLSWTNDALGESLRRFGWLFRSCVLRESVR